MSAALALYRLQQVDSQIDQAQTRLKAIRQILENDVELRAAADQFAAAEEKFRTADQLLTKSGQDVEKQRLKIQQTEASLYSGMVHNPKELQDLEKEIASLKRHLETLEERELESMSAAETAEKQMEQSKERLEKLRSDRGEQFLGLSKEGEILNRELEKLSSERDAVMKDINTQAVRIYEQLRIQRRGLAVATISDGSCAACGTNLTQSLQQSARSASQLFYCSTCGRVLYAN